MALFPVINKSMMNHQSQNEKSPESASTIWRSGTDTGQHEKQLSEFAKHKSRAEAVALHILDHYPQYRKQAERLQSCGLRLNYWHFFEKDQWRLRGGITCRQHFLCGSCARRRCTRFSYAYADKVRAVVKQRPECPVVFITLTVKNGPDFIECFDRAERGRKGFLTHRRQALAASTTARGKIRDSILKYVAGGAGTYEFKRGKNSGLFHPHIHQIAVLEPVFKFSPVEEDFWRIDPETGLWIQDTKTIYKPLEFEAALSDLWYELTGDSYIVDVRRINFEDEEEFFGALLEVFSYTLKINELSIEDQMLIYQAMTESGRSRRLIFSYGCMRGVDLTESNVDPVGDELKMEKYFDVWYRYNRRAVSYDLDQEMSNFTPQIYEGGEFVKPAKSIRRHSESGISAEDVSEWVKSKQDAPF